MMGTPFDDCRAGRRELGEDDIATSPLSPVGADRIVAAVPADAEAAGRAPTLLFVHLPRTAGTTLNGILFREYGEHAFLKLERGLAMAGGEVILGEDPLSSLDPQRRDQI